MKSKNIYKIFAKLRKKFKICSQIEETKSIVQTYRLNSTSQCARVVLIIDFSKL